MLIFLILPKLKTLLPIIRSYFNNLIAKARVYNASRKLTNFPFKCSEIGKITHREIKMPLISLDSAKKLRKKRGRK